MKAKSFVFIFSVVGLLSFGGILASAAGTWEYGYTFSTAYSNYHHPSKTHSATVVNNNTGRQGYDSRSSGVWAKAIVGRNFTEKATFYYNYW